MRVVYDATTLRDGTSASRNDSKQPSAGASPVTRTLHTARHIGRDMQQWDTDACVAFALESGNRGTDTVYKSTAYLTKNGASNSYVTTR